MIFQLCVIEELELNRIRLVPGAAKLIAAALSENNGIQRLSLSNSHLEPGDLRWFLLVLEVNRNIDGLDLSGVNLAGEGSLAVLSALKVSNALKKLDLSSTGINRAPGNVLTNILKELETNGSLEELNLYGNLPADNSSNRAFKCDWNEMSIAEMLGGNTPLRKLNIGSIGLTTRGSFAIIQALENNHVIESIDLSFNKIMPHHLEYLAEILESKNVTLQRVNLSGNEMSVKVAGKFANMLLRNITLQELDLSDNPEIPSDVMMEINKLLSINRFLQQKFPNLIANHRALKKMMIAFLGHRELQTVEDFDQKGLRAIVDVLESFAHGSIWFVCPDVREINQLWSISRFLYEFFPDLDKPTHVFLKKITKHILDREDSRGSYIAIEDVDSVVILDALRDLNAHRDSVMDQNTLDNLTRILVVNRFLRNIYPDSDWLDRRVFKEVIKKSWKRGVDENIGEVGLIFRIGNESLESKAILKAVLAVADAEYFQVRGVAGGADVEGEGEASDGAVASDAAAGSSGRGQQSLDDIIDDAMRGFLKIIDNPRIRYGEKRDHAEKMFHIYQMLATNLVDDDQKMDARKKSVVYLIYRYGLELAANRQAVDIEAVKRSLMACVIELLPEGERMHGLLVRSFLDDLEASDTNMVIVSFIMEIIKEYGEWLIKRPIDCPLLEGVMMNLFGKKERVAIDRFLQRDLEKKEIILDSLLRCRAEMEDDIKSLEAQAERLRRGMATGLKAVEDSLKTMRDKNGRISQKITSVEEEKDRIVGAIMIPNMLVRDDLRRLFVIFIGMLENTELDDDGSLEARSSVAILTFLMLTCDPSALQILPLRDREWLIDLLCAELEKMEEGDKKKSLEEIMQLVKAANSSGGDYSRSRDDDEDGAAAAGAAEEGQASCCNVM